MKISLVEPYNHFEVLYNLCQLLLQKPLTLLVFTQKYIHENAPEELAQHSNIQWHTFESENKTLFFRRRLSLLNTAELIIWITVVTPLGWINKLKLTPPMILVVHNRFTWFEPFKHIVLSTHTFRSFWLDLFRLAVFFFSQRREQQKMLCKVIAVGFPGNNILREAQRVGHLPASGKALYIPFSCYQRRKVLPFSDNDENVRIVIPGTVIDNGRDYELLANAFEDALPQFIYPVELCLLGRMCSKKGLEKLKKIQGAFFQLITFDKWVNQQDYEHHLLKACFLVLPFKPFRKFGVVREHLGTSAISGGVSDMIQYGIPALCSHHYQIDPGLDQLITTYEDQAKLKTLLVDWVNRKTYLKAREGAMEALAKLDCENLGHKFWADLRRIMTE